MLGQKEEVMEIGWGKVGRGGLMKKIRAKRRESLN